MHETNGFYKRLKQLDDIINTQKQSGNFDYNEYQLGLANGLILAQAILSGINEPEYLTPPPKWLRDEVFKDKPEEATQ